MYVDIRMTEDAVYRSLLYSIWWCWATVFAPVFNCYSLLQLLGILLWEYKPSRHLHFFRFVSHRLKSRSRMSESTRANPITSNATLSLPIDMQHAVSLIMHMASLPRSVSETWRCLVISGIRVIKRHKPLAPVLSDPYIPPLLPWTSSFFILHPHALSI